MADLASIAIRYDPRGDVLYLVLRHEPAARAVEDAQGIVWRYAGDGRPLGATILDFRDAWAEQQGPLAEHLARGLGIGLAEAQATLARAPT